MKLWHLFLICWACQVRVCSLGASVSGLKWVTFIRSCENNLTKQTKKEQKINTGHFDHPEHTLNLTLYTWTVVNSDFSLKIVFAVGLAVKCLKNCSWSTLQTLHQHLKRTNHRNKQKITSVMKNEVMITLCMFRPAGKLPCPPNRPFRCRNDRVCLRTEQICNGANDCGDNSDEEDCGECGTSVSCVLSISFSKQSLFLSFL